MKREEFDSLVTRFKSGDKEPLLEVVRDAPMSGYNTGSNVTQDMEPPDNDVWFDVEAAYSDGELSKAQFDELDDALRAKYA